MEGSAFQDSTIQNSTINTDAFKGGPQSVMAQNSPISITNHMHYYGEPDNQGYRHNDVQQTRQRVVTFSDQETRERRNLSPANWSKTSEIPDAISRLPNRDESSQIPEPVHPLECGYSVSGRTTTTGGRPAPRFKAVLESRKAMQEKMKLRIEAAIIRGYMQSDFFFSDTAIPLWEPSPGYNLRKAFKISNVCVGDVGMFTKEGGFYVLFNAFLHHDDNVKLGFKPPQNFQPYGPFQFSEDVSSILEVSLANNVSLEGDFKFDPEIPRHPNHPERKYIKAYHLVRKHGKKQKSLSSGTLLALPNGFWRDRMHPTMVSSMQGYFGLHAESWYNHYTERFPGPIPEGHLNIVSTSYKCSTWALAIGLTTSPDKVFARLSPLSPNSEILYEWDTHGDVVGRNGPLSEEIGDDGLPLVNQCVAVEVYSIEKTNSMQKMGASMNKIMSKLSIRSRSSTVKHF